MTRTPTPKQLDLPNGDVALFPPLFAPDDADRLFRAMLTTTEWWQDAITLSPGATCTAARSSS